MIYQEAKLAFDQYTKRYDLTNKRIKSKYFHSLRVANLCLELANHLGLADDDKHLAFIIGLLHDIARFEQIKRYNTFDDFKSFDHGKEGVKILFKNDLIRSFIKDDKYDHIIKKTLYIHNKYRVSNDYQALEKLFSYLLRDADKIDVLYLTTKRLKPVIVDSPISAAVLTDVLNKTSVRSENVNNEYDHLILVLALIYDIKFSYSFKLIKDLDYISKIATKLEFKNSSYSLMFNKIIKEINNFVDEKLKEALC